MLRALLLDDDPMFGRAMVRLAAGRDIDLTAVETIAQARELLGSRRFDAVLCDYHLGKEGLCSPVVAELVEDAQRVAVYTSDVGGARRDAKLAGVPILSKSELGAALDWVADTP